MNLDEFVSIGLEGGTCGAETVSLLSTENDVFIFKLRTAAVNGIFDGFSLQVTRVEHLKNFF